MKRILTKRSIRAFWEKHPDSEVYLKTWYATVKAADWQKPTDVKQCYAHASILKDSRVVFSLKCNSYYVIAKINYYRQWLFICFVGTDEEYGKMDMNAI